MATAYVDLQTIHNPATGAVAPAAWGDQVRENFESLIDPPACSASNAAGQSVNNASSTVLTAPDEAFDNDGMHSTVSQTSRITFQKAGRYDVLAAVQFDTNGTGFRYAELLINGSLALLLAAIPAVSGFPTAFVASRKRTFIVGDYVEVRAHQTSGGALNVFLLEFAASKITR